MADDMTSGKVTTSMMDRLRSMRAAFDAEGRVAAEVRIDRLNRAIGLLVDHAALIEQAISDDFGHRSHDSSRMADVNNSIGQLKFARDHLRNWMKPEKRKVESPLGLLGAKARVEFQAKGVVGIVAPWNFPVNMVFAPLAGVLAAGNRAMIKPSEFTPRTSELLVAMFAKAFDADEISVFTGGPEVGQAFTSLPFDHLVFTGATSIGRHVMRAAAENLVPVTLELGGKSPVIIGRSADMEKAAARIMNGKTLNAGQICLAPDYVLVAKEQRDAFVSAARAATEKLFPTMKDNDDFTSVINQRHHERLRGYLDDARAKGAEIIELKPEGEDFSQQPHRKMPPTLVLAPTDDMRVMQDEIFGPILPVATYDDVREAVNTVQRRDRPLALYYFGSDSNEQEFVLSNTHSGGVTINDVIFHNAMEDLPFGGIGPSGIGAYHGRDGFREFSHKRAIYQQTGSELIAMLRPPYGEMFRKQMAKRLKR